MTVYRLREDIERFFITDINSPASSTAAQSEIVVMKDIAFMPYAIDQAAFNHVRGGGNALYMDGHVKFIRYPGDFPISRSWIAILTVLSG